MSLTTVLEKLETNVELRDSNWCLSPSGCKLLMILVKSVQAKTICEIGTSIGFSTLHLAQAAYETKGKVHTIEYYESRQSQAKSFIQDAGLSNVVEFHQGKALEIIPELLEKNMVFDFVFVDAAKNEYLSYFNLLAPIMPTGGIFVADNTRSHREQMSDFVEAINQDNRFDVSDLDTPMGLIIARKK